MGYTPTKAMKEEAQRGLQWRRKYKRGGTEVGIARARDISNGKDLPIDTVKRMKSFFARHEQNKKAEGWSPGEKGFPSNGRIAWALWGGDPGMTWANNILDKEELISSGGSMTIIDNLGITSPKYVEVLNKAKERWGSLQLECPEDMVVGWPFRFLSVGKVFCHHTIATSSEEEEVYQRGKDITLEDLQDALKYFHQYKNPINIDREHNMSEPRGIVLDVFLATDEEGSPCLACIPAYGKELASYVESCNGILYSSPSIEWASESGSFVDKKTGETIGKFRLTGLAVCVEPGQAPRILDRVRLNAEKDSIFLIGNNKKEKIPNKNNKHFLEIVDKDTVIVQDSNKDSEYAGSKGDKLMDPEQVMKALSEMLDEKFSFLVDFMTKLEEKLDKIAEKAMDEESSEEASDEVDVPEEEVSEKKDEDMKSDKEEKLSALQAELESLKEEKYNRLAHDAVVALGLPKSQHKVAMKAWRAEHVDNIGENLGYKPFSDVFSKNTKISTGDGRGHSDTATIGSLDAATKAIMKSDNVSYSKALELAIDRYPALAGK